MGDAALFERDNSSGHAHSTRTYFGGLNPLRLFAALSVLAFHVAGIDGFAAIPASGPLSWIRGGWVGLDIFFVTSGLVVGQSALSGWRKNGPDFRADFVLHRLARIVPLYFLTGLVCAIFFSTFANDTVLQLLSHVFFVHNFWPSTIMSINPPSWSLAVEMQLYFMLLIATPWLSQRSAWSVAAASIACALLYRTAVYFGAAPMGTDWLQHLIFQTPGLTDGFGLGVAAAIAISRIRHPVGIPACALLIAIGLYGLHSGSLLTPSIADGSIWSHPTLAITMRTGIAMSALAFVTGCALMPMPASGKWSRRVAHAGDLSYGIYLWHFAVLSAALRLTSLSGWTLLGAVAAVSIVMAEITWFAVERPVLRRVAGYRRLRAAADVA